MWKLISGLSLTFGVLAVDVAVADETATAPKPSVVVEFCGRLRHGVVAIGGECTGTTISINGVTWDVQLDTDAERTFANEHHKQTVVVSGSLRKVTGIETKDRWIIDARKLSKQDVAKDKAGVRIAMLGILRAAGSNDAAAGSMTIDADRQAWPIDLSSAADLKTTAESLVGQPAVLTGTLKEVTEDDFGTGPVILVTTLKPRPQMPDQKRPNPDAPTSAQGR